MAESENVKIMFRMKRSEYDEYVRTAEKNGIDFSELLQRGMGLQKFLLEHNKGKLILETPHSLNEIVLKSPK